MNDHAELNGRVTNGVDVGLLRATSFGHYSSMQVRDAKVHGLDLHLDRLDRSSVEVFGHGLDRDRVREYMRSAVGRAGRTDSSVRVTAFSADGSAIRGLTAVEPDVLVMVSAPVEPATTPLRLRSVEYERFLPYVKHTGTFGLVHLWRQATLAGYDDALFTDRHGRVSEASIWNICFVDGDPRDGGAVVWPDAPALPGITMLLIRDGLRRLGVRSVERTIRTTDCGAYDAAFLTNSIDVALPVATIDRTSFKARPELRDALVAAYDAVPPQPL